MKKRWHKLLSTKRHGEKENLSIEDIRSDFQKDYDRIIFSNSFRRLGNKTQVHPLSKNDHVHTRLTHSLEVSSVGRSLGLMVGEFLKNRGDLPEGYDSNDIASVVQVACLAHDIGNPPFGHAGEFAIRHWFESEGERYLQHLSNEKHDFLKFEGNAQGFRILTKLEEKYMNGGMRLTYASLASVVKYPWTSDSPKAVKKFNVFQSEKKVFEEIFTYLELKNNEEYIRHPLSYLMEAADDICYSILDLEDAVELSIISYNEAKEILCDIIELKNENGSYLKEIEKIPNKRKRVSRLRAKAIDSLIKMIFEEFENNYLNLMQGNYKGSLIDNLNNKELNKIFDTIKKINFENIFVQKRVVEIEIGAYEIISIIMNNLVETVYLLDKVKQIKNLSFKHQRLLDIISVDERPTENSSYYENLLKITDYVSGMTDNYAMYIANQFSGKFNV